MCCHAAPTPWVCARRRALFRRQHVASSGGLLWSYSMHLVTAASVRSDTPFCWSVTVAVHPKATPEWTHISCASSKSTGLRWCQRLRLLQGSQKALMAIRSCHPGLERTRGTSTEPCPPGVAQPVAVEPQTEISRLEDGAYPPMSPL